MNKKDSGKLKLRNFEAKQNLLGFFSLLLKIDKRNNPHLYKNNEDNRDTNNTDKTK